MIFSTAAATTSSCTSPLTMADIHRGVEKLSELFGKARSNYAPGNISGPLGGIEVRESINACQTKPARAHKRRRNQTASYHARIQKKWNKRFGMVKKPAAFMIDTSLLLLPFSGDLPRRMLVAHPSIVEQIRILHGGLRYERQS
jgi:hypothetical protein